jgi:glycosyltransferase involved in cell wall biosynthesis
LPSPEPKWAGVSAAKNENILNYQQVGLPGVRNADASHPTLSIVIPFYNEARSIPALFPRLFATLEQLGESWEVVCVNDGSSDLTLPALLAERSREPRLFVLDFSRNFGKECAVAAGLRQARGQAVVIMNADLQHPPETIAEMLARWRQGSELVNAARDERTGQSRRHRLLARAFYLVMNRLADVEIRSGIGDFRLLDRRVVNTINAMPERRRFLKGILAWVGFRQIDIVYRQEERCAGVSRWGFWRLLRLAFDGLTGFSTVPLTIWGYIGAAISGLAFCYIVVRLIRVAFWGIDVPGYESIIVAVLFFGGIQLLSLGILGTYIGRVFEEVKQRPPYVISEVYDAAPASAETRIAGRP